MSPTPMTTTPSAAGPFPAPADRNSAVRRAPALAGATAPLLFALATSLLLPSPPSARAASDSAASTAPFTERVVVPLSQPGKPAHVAVGLIQGGITVEAWEGKEVVVHATVRGEEDHDDRDDRDDDREARLERRLERQLERADADGERPRGVAGMRKIPSQSLGLTIEEENNELEIGTESWHQAVDLRIQVPADSTLELSCINDGDIVVRGVRGEMELSNTNGEISVTGAASPVVAETVNGDITIVFTRLESKRPLAFSTLNGNLDLTLPAALAADLALRTDNGDIYSDFEIKFLDTPTRRAESREGGRYRIEIEKLVRGRINGGGPELSLKTFNGDIVLRRGG